VKIMQARVLIILLYSAIAIGLTPPRHHLSCDDCLGDKREVISSDGKIDSNRFARPNRFRSIHTAES